MSGLWSHLKYFEAGMIVVLLLIIVIYAKAQRGGKFWQWLAKRLDFWLIDLETIAFLTGWIAMIVLVYLGIQSFK